VGSALKYLFSLLLGDTANHREFLPLFPELLEIGQAVKDFLLSLVANGTGIVENQLGLLDGIDLAVSLGDERADDLLGVVNVHLASEGLDKEGFLPQTHYVSPSGKALTSSITDLGLGRDWQITTGTRR
jgi:hypothetical protein